MITPDGKYNIVYGSSLSLDNSAKTGAFTISNIRDPDSSQPVLNSVDDRLIHQPR